MATIAPPFFVVHSLVNVAPQTVNARKILGYQGKVVAIAPGVVVIRRVDNFIEEIEPAALVTRV